MVALAPSRERQDQRDHFAAIDDPADEDPLQERPDHDPDEDGPQQRGDESEGMKDTRVAGQ